MAKFRKFTGREIYDAMVKNGLQQIREKYIQIDENGKIIAGCLLSQAAFNLNVLPTNAESLQESTGKWTDSTSDFGNIYSMLEEFSVPDTSKWKFSHVVGLGETIISWYDKHEPSPDPYDVDYVLSYEESLKMVSDLFTDCDVWDEVFNLEVRDGGWTFGE